MPWVVNFVFKYPLPSIKNRRCKNWSSLVSILGRRGSLIWLRGFEETGAWERDSCKPPLKGHRLGTLACFYKHRSRRRNPSAQPERWPFELHTWTLWVGRMRQGWWVGNVVNDDFPIMIMTYGNIAMYHVFIEFEMETGWEILHQKFTGNDFWLRDSTRSRWHRRP